MIDTQAFLEEYYKDNSRLSVRWLVGCDYGTSTVMSWGLYAKLPNGTILKVKEYYWDAIKEKAQKTDSEFANEFEQFVQGYKPWAVYCDPSAASWKVELARRGFRVQNANNDVLSGIRVVAKSLNMKTFLIDKSCVNTQKEYASYAWDRQAQLNGVDRPIKAHDHTCDTDRYVVYTESLFGMSGVYKL